MGDIGKISRLLSLFFGSPFTYVSLTKSIAPGQFKLDEVKSMLMRSG
jgi:3-dehydroquinate dehydratase-1